MVPAWVQLPLPLQNEGSWWTPLLQDSARPHVTFVPACVQPPLPLQVPPAFPQGGAAAHWPDGAAVPAARFVHVPGVVPLQVWQVPQLGVPQQTLFTQAPLVHWLPAVHEPPLVFLATQDVPEQ
jgi:hypothetical protein